MKQNFKDHFSDKSDAYSIYRPEYPDELFAYLSSCSLTHDRAWDCGTGSGQSAIALSDYYKEVIATDASENQIKNARQKAGVVYKTEPAEQTSLDDASIDLVTVAQAIHWFKLDAFANEVTRVLKPGGIVAVWTYGLHQISPGIDKVIHYLYGSMLDPYWPAERRYVEEGYRNIHLPMKQLEAPAFNMAASWNLAQLTGYLRTWSAVKRYETATGSNPVDKIYDELHLQWGNADNCHLISWPLTLKLWH